jgi:hypothetical protein
VGTKKHASCGTGVRLFLNICASYLKVKKSIGREEKINDYQEINEADEEWEVKFVYEEPFGSFTTNLGTEEFPCFNFPFPSIIRQTNSFDCGLAVVANSMAFVKHLESVSFEKSQMKRQDTNIGMGGKEVCYDLLEGILYNHFLGIR